MDLPAWKGWNDCVSVEADSTSETCSIVTNQSFSSSLSSLDVCALQHGGFGSLAEVPARYSSSTPCKPLLRPVAKVSLILLQMVMLSQLFLRPSQSAACNKLKITFTVGSITVFGSALVFAQFTQGFADPLTVKANTYIVLASAYLLLSGYHAAAFCWNQAVETPAAKATSVALELVKWSAYPIVVYKFTGLVQERLRLMEAGFSTSLGSRTIHGLRIAHVAVEVGLVVSETSANFVLKFPRSMGYAFLWASGFRIFIHNVFTSGLYLAVGVVAFGGFTTVLSSMKPWTRHLGPYVKAEKCWAVQVLQLLRWATLIILSCSALLHLVLGGIHFFDYYLHLLHVARGLPNLIFATVQPILVLMESGFLLVVTGWLRPQRENHSCLLQRRESASLPSRTPSRPGIWTATVQALASRSLGVGELLDFYELLGPAGQAMRHYRPEESTTVDVVRQVVIPLSRTVQGGMPYTALLRPQQSRSMPQRMVTHTWTSRFVNLVAAVVADALDRDEYKSVADALADGRSRELRAQLDMHGTLEQSYWICAFCVNQHSSICGSLGTAPPEGGPEYEKWDHFRRDTVTKEIFSTCPCSQPKHSNDSLECEMNKFDDMIELLSKEVPGFQQLVAVDGDYAVFTRAWCVAEMHRAHFMGIPQKVCLRQNHVLDIDTDDLTVYKKLARLSVSDCEASRPEDKDEILHKIGDLEDFDEQLQEMIFGNRGLLRQQFAGFGMLEAAARIALRVARTQSLNSGSGGQAPHRAQV